MRPGRCKRAQGVTGITGIRAMSVGLEDYGEWSVLDIYHHLVILVQRAPMRPANIQQNRPLDFLADLQFTIARSFQVEKVPMLRRVLNLQHAYICYYIAIYEESSFELPVNGNLCIRRR